VVLVDEVIEVVEEGSEGAAEAEDAALQVVVVGVGIEVVEVVAEIAGVAVLVEEEEAAEVVPEEAQTLSLNLTDILVFLLPKAKTICWSPKISSPENLYMARNGYLLKVVWKAQKLNTVFGIHFVASWLLEYWVDWTISLSNPAAEFCILGLRVERVLAMLLILLDLMVSSTLLNFQHGQVVT
jgi:hypothetical protein